MFVLLPKETPIWSVHIFRYGIWKGCIILCFRASSFLPRQIMYNLSSPLLPFRWPYYISSVFWSGWIYFSFGCEIILLIYWLVRHQYFDYIWSYWAQDKEFSVKLSSCCKHLNCSSIIWLADRSMNGAKFLHYTIHVLYYCTILCDTLNLYYENTHSAIIFL